MTDSSPDFPTNPADIAILIGIPLTEWPGNCHAVAEAIKDRLPVHGMRIARGHWVGHISRDSVYHHGPQQHTWLKLADGRVLDPTRWAILTPHNPSIYLGVCDHYDEGGRQLSARVTPPFSDGQMLIVRAMDDDARNTLATLLDMRLPVCWDDSSLSRLASNLRYAVHEDPDRQPNVDALYDFLQNNQCKAMIPIDSWNRVKEIESITCNPMANLHYSLPAAPDLSDAEVLLNVFTHFLSIEERDSFEDDLDAFDISINEFWDALNQLESMIKTDLGIKYLSPNAANILCLVAGEYLGQGFGQVLRVDRYAESLGASPERLNQAMMKLGERCGYDLRWDVPKPSDPVLEPLPTP